MANGFTEREVQIVVMGSRAGILGGTGAVSLVKVKAGKSEGHC